jgi:hypothetical protein
MGTLASCPTRHRTRAVNNSAGKKRVTLDDLGNVGEFIGGIGVAISLLYLAVQITQSRRIEQLNAIQTVGEVMTKVMDQLSNDSELYRILSIARDTGEELTDDDRELQRSPRRLSGDPALPQAAVPNSGSIPTQRVTPER